LIELKQFFRLLLGALTPDAGTMREFESF